MWIWAGFSPERDERSEVSGEMDSGKAEGLIDIDVSRSRSFANSLFKLSRIRSTVGCEYRFGV